MIALLLDCLIAVGINVDINLFAFCQKTDRAMQKCAQTAIPVRQNLR
jgi:hypothetical protein